MPKLKITKTFPFAHRGCEVVTYHAGSEIDTADQELINTVLAEKWGHRPRNRTKPDGTDAPEGTEGTEGAEGTEADDTAATDATDANPDTPQP